MGNTTGTTNCSPTNTTSYSSTIQHIVFQQYNKYANKVATIIVHSISTTFS
jgi:hypothetical protein